MIWWYHPIFCLPLHKIFPFLLHETSPRSRNHPTAPIIQRYQSNSMIMPASYLLHVSSLDMTPFGGDLSSLSFAERALTPPVCFKWSSGAVTSYSWSSSFKTSEFQHLALKISTPVMKMFINVTFSLYASTAIRVSISIPIMICSCECKQIMSIATTALIATSFCT